MRARTGSKIEVCLFLQRNQKSLAQKHAHLLAAHLALRIQVKHLRNDEEIVIVLLGIRSLPGLKHIFERERMQMESFPKHAQHIEIAQPDDVDPGHSFFIEVP
jgi:hypothetical protein